MKKFLLSLVASAFAMGMSAQTNLLENAGFEEWADNYPVAWKSTTTASNTSSVSLSQSSDAHSGSYSACIKNLASNQRLSYKELNLKAGTYTFTFWAKAEDGVNGSTRGGYAPWDAAKNALGSYVWNKDYTNNITDWQEITFTFELKAQTQVNLVIMNPKSTDTNKYSNLLIDDASLTTTDGGLVDGGEGGGEVTPDVPGNDFVAALTDAQGNWTYEDVVIPEDLTYIWSQSSSYGMKASAYANNTKYVTDSYLVSPSLKLGAGSVLTFEHVQRYAAEDPASQLTLWIREAGAKKWAAQLTIPTYSDGSNWTFVESGNIDLAAYANKTVQIGFRYTSDENAAPTWEIKNVKVTNASATEAGPTLKDPSNTLETAYTIAQAIEIINDKANYDMSKEVYVKGVITSIKSIDVSKYERAQYYIGETVDAETTIQVYNGYYLDGAAFTADDQIKVGDEVVVLGKLTLYNTTYEIDQNNKIVLLNGKGAEGIEAVTIDTTNAPVFDLQGRRVNRAQNGVFIVNGKKVVR